MITKSWNVPMLPWIIGTRLEFGSKRPNVPNEGFLDGEIPIEIEIARCVN